MNDRVWLALVHHPTLDRGGRVVSTAVTPLDVHDLARLARTYGLGGVQLVTPLEAQRVLVGDLLAHWTRGVGARLNPCRREALERVELVDGLDGACGSLEARTGRAALVVGTSARPGDDRVAFSEARARIAAHPGPVLLVFGTGWGLAPEGLAACRWVLEPVRGAGVYNHLSVRSAASIVVDRLFD